MAVIGVLETIGALILLAFVILGLLIGWERYRGTRSRAPGGVSGARPTSEVFIDPETGRLMRVWFDERTGQREYRPE